MSTLAHLYDELKHKGLVLIGVTKDEEADKARGDLGRSRPLCPSMPVTLDPDGYDQRFDSSEHQVENRDGL